MIKRRTDNKGFTILELLIATTVFGVMLLLVGGVIVQLSRQFYKGLVKARTQEVARTISEEIASNIQYSASTVQYLGVSDSGVVQGWCIADRRYMFVLSRKLGADAARESKGVLMRDANCAADLPDKLEPAPDRVELIGENMRLAAFDLCPNSTDPTSSCYGASDDVWALKIRVVYGDTDLLCSPSKHDCDSITTTFNVSEPDLSCKTQVGSQYCAVSEYATTVARRL